MQSCSDADSMFTAEYFPHCIDVPQLLKSFVRIPNKKLKWLDHVYTMRTMYQTAWQCINHCTVFETVGVPTFCPHCGSKVLEPQDSGIERYDKYDERYVNHGERSSNNG